MSRTSELPDPNWSAPDQEAFSLVCSAHDAVTHAINAMTEHSRGHAQAEVLQAGVNYIQGGNIIRFLPRAAYNLTSQNRNESALDRRVESAHAALVESAGEVTDIADILRTNRDYQITPEDLHHMIEFGMDIDRFSTQVKRRYVRNAGANLSFFWIDRNVFSLTNCALGEDALEEELQHNGPADRPLARLERDYSNIREPELYLRQSYLTTIPVSNAQREKVVQLIFLAILLRKARKVSNTNPGNNRRWLTAQLERNFAPFLQRWTTCMAGKGPVPPEPANTQPDRELFRLLIQAETELDEAKTAIAALGNDGAMFQAGIGFIAFGTEERRAHLETIINEIHPTRPVEELIYGDCSAIATGTNHMHDVVRELKATNPTAPHGRLAYEVVGADRIEQLLKLGSNYFQFTLCILSRYNRSQVMDVAQAKDILSGESTGIFSRRNRENDPPLLREGNTEPSGTLLYCLGIIDAAARQAASVAQSTEFTIDEQVKLNRMMLCTAMVTNLAHPHNSPAFELLARRTLDNEMISLTEEFCRRLYPRPAAEAELSRRRAAFVPQPRRNFGHNW